MRKLALAGSVLLALVATADEDLGYVLMPPSEDGSYRVSTGSDDNRHWGRPETIRMLILVAREWHKRHGSKYVLSIGDISRRDGAEFPPHVTHRDGCNIDITTSPASVCNVNFEDQAISLDLARLFFQYGAKEILYNGEMVGREEKRVTEWPKHDDHFHVIVDPSKVPADGDPLLVAEGDCVDGSTLGPSRLVPQKAGAAPKFVVAWRLLGAERWQKTYRVVVDRDTDEANGTLLDTGKVGSAATQHVVQLPLEDGAELHWRVVLTGASGELTLPWQKMRVDFTPPTVIGKAPGEGEAVDENPLLKWECDPSTRQASFRVELAFDPAQKRPSFDSGTVRRTTSSYRVKGQLPKGKTLWWRVTVDDGHGNVGTGAWRSFTTGEKYAWIGDIAEVDADELNLREGASENKDIVVKLAKGERVYVVGRKDEWLKVVVVRDGKRLQGYVAAKYVNE